MNAKAFFTNVLIYAFAENDPRAEAAEALVAAGGTYGDVKRKCLDSQAVSFFPFFSPLPPGESRVRGSINP